MSSNEVPFYLPLYPTIPFFPSWLQNVFFLLFCSCFFPPSQALLLLPSFLSPSLLLFPLSFLLSSLFLPSLHPSFLSFLSFLLSPLSLCPPHLPSSELTHSLPACLLMPFQADLSDLGSAFAPRNLYQLPYISTSPPSSLLLNLQILLCHLWTSSVTAVLLPRASSPYHQLTPLLFFFPFSSCLSDVVRVAGANEICQSTPFCTSSSKSHPAFPRNSTCE